MYKGLAIVFGFYFLGEITTEILNLPIPGNVIGLILLSLTLLIGLIDLEDVEQEAEFFIDNMSILFIPPGVGIMLYFGLLKTELLPLAGALIFSFLITLILTGKAVEVLR